MVEIPTHNGEAGAYHRCHCSRAIGAQTPIRVSWNRQQHVSGSFWPMTAVTIRKHAPVRPRADPANVPPA